MILNRAEQRWEEAENALYAWPSWEEYFAAKIKQDVQYQALQAEPEQKEVFRVYEESLGMSLKEAWAQERKTLEEAVKEAENAYELAKNAYEAAMMQAKRIVEDAGRETTSTKSGIMELEQRKEALQKKMGIYQELMEQKGQIACGMEGTIQSIHVSAGDMTTDLPALHLTDDSRGWVFETVLSGGELQYLNTGVSVTLKFQNETGQTRLLANCPVRTVTKADEANYLVKVQMDGKKMVPGQTGVLEYTKKEGPYDCCIPTSAIHTIDGKSYIFVIRETDTILGTELHVVKRPVKIVDQNDAWTALESGALGEKERFVTGCDRELTAGDVVRPMEGDFEK